jgi:NADH-quinone oxidoreductase subunit C
VQPDRVPENTVAIALNEQFADAIIDVTNVRDELNLVVSATHLVPFCSALRMNFGFERLSAITAVDWWPQNPRFEVVYLLHSIKNNARLRVKVLLGENEEIESVCHIWRAANWYERETFDLFGIRFRNHPNLERIMMPVDWDGHPLRKDYPVHGHKYSYQDE